MSEYVVLVDERDRKVGEEEKLKAHRDGKLHRAFSIFLFNQRGELLIQRRAKGKYHSGGLWANTCCGHPRPQENVEQAAVRRLQEEIGISCELKRAFHFIYRAEVNSGLVEHEVDHVFIGYYGGLVSPNPTEVMAHRWTSLSDLQEEIRHSPDNFVPWLSPALEGLSGERPFL